MRLHHRFGVTIIICRFIFQRKWMHTLCWVLAAGTPIVHGKRYLLAAISAISTIYVNGFRANAFCDFALEMVRQQSVKQWDLGHTECVWWWNGWLISKPIGIYIRETVLQAIHVIAQQMAELNILLRIDELSYRINIHCGSTIHIRSQFTRISRGLTTSIEIMQKLHPISIGASGVVRIVFNSRTESMWQLAAAAAAVVVARSLTCENPLCHVMRAPAYI